MVSLTAMDADRNDLEIQVSVDASEVWFPVLRRWSGEGVGHVVGLAIHGNWKQPPLEDGASRFLLGAVDGFDRGGPVIRTVTVGVLGRTATESVGTVLQCALLLEQSRWL
jgi:hypothetical protein